MSARLSGYCGACDLRRRSCSLCGRTTRFWVSRISTHGGTPTRHIQHPVEVTIPARLSVQRRSDSLTVAYDLASLRNVTIMVGKKMTIGMKDDFRIYEEGRARPPSGILSLSGMKEQEPPCPIRDTNFLNSMETLTIAHDGIPAEGKRYVVEHDIILFETDLPAQHFWSPEGGKKYRVLWEEKLRAVR